MISSDVCKMMCDVMVKLDRCVVEIQMSKFEDGYGLAHEWATEQSSVKT